MLIYIYTHIFIIKFAKAFYNMMTKYLKHKQFIINIFGIALAQTNLK